jgi:hypothetical protein
LVWNDEKADFTDLPSQPEVDEVLEYLEDHNPCISCGIRLREESRELLHPIPDGFTQWGLKYHVGDFIYIRPPENCAVLEIAQIMKIKDIPADPSVTVRFFGRYDKSLGGLSSPFLDDVSFSFSVVLFDLDTLHQRRLYLRSQMEEIIFDRIDGLCYVQHLTDPDAIEKWVQHDDNFYVNQESNGDGLLVPMHKRFLKACRGCSDERITKLQHAEVFKNNNQPLRGLELFSGVFTSCCAALSPKICTRCWWTWDWHEHVWFCGDKIRCGIFTICCSDLSVRIHICTINTHLTEWIERTTPTPQSIAKTRAFSSKMPLKRRKGNLLLCSSQMMVRHFASPCLKKAKSILYLGVCHLLVFESNNI